MFSRGGWLWRGDIYSEFAFILMRRGVVITTREIIIYCTASIYYLRIFPLGLLRRAQKNYILSTRTTRYNSVSPRLSCCRVLRGRGTKYITYFFKDIFEHSSWSTIVGAWRIFEKNTLKKKNDSTADIINTRVRGDY